MYKLFLFFSITKHLSTLSHIIKNVLYEILYKISRIPCHSADISREVKNPRLNIHECLIFCSVLFNNSLNVCTYTI